MESTVTIRLLENEVEVQDAYCFVRRHAHARYDADPPPPPEALLAAYRRGEVVGTIGVDFTAVDTGELSLERIWSFDPANAPLPFNRQEIAQYGRWFTVEQDVSLMLVYGATIFARTHGKRSVLAEMKPGAARVLERVGIAMLPIQNAQLVLENIEESGRFYYVNGPPPQLCMADLSGVEDAALQRIPGLKGMNICF